MPHRSWPCLVPTLLWLALVSCGENTTQPETIGPRTRPELAVAPNSWITLADMPTGRFGPATGVVTSAAGQSTLYAIGGTTATGGSLSKVQAYNVATNKWSTKAPLPKPLYWTNGVGVINGKLYISGGVASSRNYRAELYMYDPATNVWTQKHDMPNTTFRGVTGVIDGNLYVLTGCDQEDCAAFEPVAFYRYDPGADQWTSLPIPTDNHTLGAGGVIGKKLYVAGGFSSQLDVYDPLTNVWTTKAPMPSARSQAGGTALNAKLYVIGGVRGNMLTRATSVYDPATNTWSNKAPLPSARFGMAASRVVLNGQARIEVVGGARPGNNLAYVP